MAESILVPLDDSSCSLAALEHAVEAHEDPRIHLLHVHDYRAAGYQATPESKLPGYWESWYRDAERNAQSLFEDAADRTQECGGGVDRTTVRVGRPAQSIVEYADDADVDQIVIGSHGRSGLSRLLRGSVSERVLRHASVPVTVVH